MVNEIIKLRDDVVFRGTDIKYIRKNIINPNY